MSAEVEYEDGLDELALADGPWNFEDVSEDHPFISYGALRLPAVPHMKVRAEIDPSNNKCGAISVKVADCNVQLQVIAAGRGNPQWTQTRQAVTERLRPVADLNPVEGHFGAELEVTLHRKHKETGEITDVPMLFQGVDGDRWLLKAVTMGPSAHTDATRARINALLSQCAVDRGPLPMIAGTVLILDLPTFHKGAAAAPDADASSVQTDGGTAQ